MVYDRWENEGYLSCGVGTRMPSSMYLDLQLGKCLRNMLTDIVVSRVFEDDKCDLNMLYALLQYDHFCRYKGR